MNKPSEQQGFALVIVLWFLMLLTILGVAHNNLMRTEILLTANMVHSAQAGTLSEAGINQAIFELLKPENEQHNRDLTYQFDGKSVAVQIRAETGKISLNTAHPELLHGLFISTGVSYDKAIALVQSILDWRDRDNLLRSNGAEDPDYKNSGLSYGAKDGYFNSVAELLLVRGMTPEIYRKVLPALTVHSNTAGIYAPAAPQQALLAIPGITASAIDNYLQQRDPNIGAHLSGIDGKYLTFNPGNIFAITSAATTSKVTVRIEALVSIRRHEHKPYYILAWQQTAAGT